MPVIPQGAGSGRDDIVGGVDFFQNELDCFVHEQFRVKSKAEVIKRFYFLKGFGDWDEGVQDTDGDLAETLA